MRTFLIVSLLSATAAADPLTLRLGHVAGGSISSMNATLGTRPDSVHATVTLVLASPSKQDREVRMRLALPPGATAVGLALNGTAGDAFFPADGRTRFDTVVANPNWKDPALLEQMKPGVLSLRVYPVNRDAPATVTIELMLPQDATLAVARPGAASETFEATMMDVFDAPAATVDAERSLVAVPPPPGARGRGWSVSSTAPRGWRPHIQTLPGAPEMDDALIASSR